MHGIVVLLSSLKGRCGGSGSTCHDVLKTTAGVGGNVLEWLDFAVFGFFSDIIGGVFFPRDQPQDLSTIESFAVFGGAFLMRPIGGLVIGYIGDVHGRKLALEISIFLMAIATFLMGSLPTYDQVGGWAIVMLLGVRLCQGLSVGGQLMSSLVYTLESHPKESWGLYGSFVMAASNFGTFLGGLVAWYLRDALSEEDLSAWGWRLPFWIGSILVGWCGIYLKYYCPEDDDLMHGHGPLPTTEQHPDHDHDHDTHATEDVVPEDELHSDKVLMGSAGDAIHDEAHAHNIDQKRVNPLKVAFSKGNIRSLAASSLVPLLWSGGFYLSFVWMVIFVGDGEFIKPAVPHAFAINSLSLTFLMIWFPLAGSLSDKFSRISVMSIGGLGMAVFGPIAVFVIATQQTVTAVLGSQLILGVAISMWGAPMCAWLVESFDPAARLTSVSIGYNIAQAVAGGLSPLVATILADEVSLKAPGIIFFGLAVLALCGLWFVSPVGNIYQYWNASSVGTEVGRNGADEIEDADDIHSLELQEIS